MIVSRENIGTLAADLKSSGARIVFTNGCFDIIHAGHVMYLAAAKQQGDILIVGLNTDSSVKRLKGSSRPVNTEEDRGYVLSALKSVDVVTYFDEDTPEQLICKIIPDVLVKGGDYSFETIVGADFVSGSGGKVVVIPLLEGRSTSRIIEKMNKE